MKRRLFLGAGTLAGVAATVGGLPAWAEQAQDFIVGPPVVDIAPVRLSPRVWMIPAPAGFPTPENRGMMANVVFAVSSVGVIVLDSGASLQIGEMALRMIRRVTERPVVAVFNSHYHGDHWLGNHAFVKTYGASLPIHALARTRAEILGSQGSLWRGLMERWTNQSTAGTQIVPPNRVVEPGQVLRFGDLTLAMHHHGVAHTPADLCVQVVEEQLTHVGDIAMGNRIANMDEGSYAGTLRTYDKLSAALGPQQWVPGHGQASRELLQRYGRFLRGIWEPCLQAVKDSQTEEQAKARVLADPRVVERAATMEGFASNIGKYISLAYLEAEKEAF